MGLSHARRRDGANSLRYTAEPRPSGIAMSSRDERHQHGARQERKHAVVLRDEKWGPDRAGQEFPDRHPPEEGQRLPHQDGDDPDGRQDRHRAGGEENAADRGLARGSGACGAEASRRAAAPPRRTPICFENSRFAHCAAASSSAARSQLPHLLELVRVLSGLQRDVSDRADELGALLEVILDERFDLWLGESAIAHVEEERPAERSVRLILDRLDRRVGCNRVPPSTPRSLSRSAFSS